jgi:hypothetical protein
LLNMITSVIVKEQLNTRLVSDSQQLLTAETASLVTDWSQGEYRSL